MADEDEERGKKRRAGDEKAADEATVKLIMSSYEGRRWMCRVLEFAAMYQPMYRMDGDVYGAMKRDGKADVGRFLLGQIDVYASNDYARLIREMKARNDRAAEAAQKAIEPEQEPEAFSPLEDMADRQMAEFQAQAAKRAAQAAKEQKTEE